MKRTPTAKTDIEHAASEAVKIISDAAGKATSAIANAALEATRLLASNAADASKVVAVKNADDHDLLVELKTDMKTVKETLQTISEKEDTHLTKSDFTDYQREDGKISTDHESRIRILEASMWKWIGISSFAAAAVSIGVAYSLKLIH